MLIFPVQVYQVSLQATFDNILGVEYLVTISIRCIIVANKSGSVKHLSLLIDIPGYLTRKRAICLVNHNSF